MKTKLYQDIKLKSGEVLVKGLMVEARPYPNKDNGCIVNVDGKEYKLRVTSVKRPPSLKMLEKWTMDGVAESVSGCRVEPDGKDADGWASWLMVAGII